LKTEILAIVLVVLVVGSLGIGYFVGVGSRQTVTVTDSLTTTFTTARSATTSSCTEVTFPGTSFCLGIWDMTFSVAVNYAGSWNVSYIVYNTGLRNVSGFYSGTGYNYTTASFEVYGLHQGMACFTATKQDSSNRTLILTLGGSSTNSTSMPYGSVKRCVTEVYA